MESFFESMYPNISRFVKVEGWIEMGYDDDSPLTSFIRALNMGGMVWEGEDEYASIDEAFKALDMALGEWMDELGI